MRFLTNVPRPSVGVVLGFTALFLALGGSAVAVTSAVNIADGRFPTHLAAVDPAGGLQVRQAAPAAFFHAAAFSLSETPSCIRIAQSPAHKALIVRQIRFDVYENPSPGFGSRILVYADTTCTIVVGNINPPTLGQFVMTFDPGLGIPDGSGLSVQVGGSIDAEAYVDGYTVNNNVVSSPNVVN